MCAHFHLSLSIAFVPFEKGWKEIIFIVSFRNMFKFSKSTSGGKTILKLLICVDVIDKLLLGL